MDPRARNNLNGWFGEVGFLYLLVAVFVGLFFLLREGWPLLSCNPAVGKKTAVEGAPGYYGRTP